MAIFLSDFFQLSCYFISKDLETNPQNSKEMSWKHNNEAVITVEERNEWQTCLGNGPE